MLFTYSRLPSKTYTKDTDIQPIQAIQSIVIHNNPNRSSLKVFDGVRDLQHIMKSTRSGCSSCG